MMLVYRIENASGDGPFQAGGSTLYQSVVYGEEVYKDSRYFPYSGPAAYEDKWNRPLPDVPLKEEHLLIYGCSSLDQFHEFWFPDKAGRAAMKEAGFDLVEYSISSEHVWIGETQVIFRKDKSLGFRMLNLVNAF